MNPPNLLTLTQAFLNERLSFVRTLHRVNNSNRSEQIRYQQERVIKSLCDLINYYNQKNEDLEFELGVCKRKLCVINENLYEVSKVLEMQHNWLPNGRKECRKSRQALESNRNTQEEKMDGILTEIEECKRILSSYERKLQEFRNFN